MDIKLKTATSLYNGKDVLVENMRTRINLLESYAVTHQSQEEEIEKLSKQLKDSRIEVSRRFELTKQLKLKIDELEQVIKAIINISLGIKKY